MYQIKTSQNTLEVLNVIIDSDLCTIQFPNTYSDETIKETFSDNLHFSILVDTSENVQSEYPYLDYIRMSEPTLCQIGDEQRKQITLYKTEKAEPTVTELLAELTRIQNEINRLADKK